GRLSLLPVLGWIPDSTVYALPGVGAACRGTFWIRNRRRGGFDDRGGSRAARAPMGRGRTVERHRADLQRGRRRPPARLGRGGAHACEARRRAPLAAA